MDTLTIALTGVGLAMDAFAVSITNGMLLKQMKARYAVYFGLYFGFFQFLMPLIGFFAGKTFSVYIERYDHYLAFLLLVVIGGKMIYEVIQGGEEACPGNDKILAPKHMVVLAIATSIDAMAVGIAFASLQVDIVSAGILIGVITFFIVVAGVYIGNKMGGLLKNGAGILGGVILIAIGCKILLEHLQAERLMAWIRMML